MYVVITPGSWDGQTLPGLVQGDGEVQLWTNSWVPWPPVCRVSVGPTATLAAPPAAMCRSKGGTEAGGEAWHTIDGRSLSMVTRPACSSRQMAPIYVGLNSNGQFF